MNPGYFPLAATALKPQQISLFLHISARVWGASVTSTHIRTEQLYVKTAIIHQLKHLCVPDCAHTESMFINFIHISLYDMSLMQNILYQIKRDVDVWKRLGCPQCKQWTGWQIVEARGWRNWLLHCPHRKYLTPCGLVTPYDDISLVQHWLR